MKGWIYVISNREIPGMVKIGYSMKDPGLRAKELNQKKSSLSYIVEYGVLVENPDVFAKLVFDHLKDCREGKDWVKCSSEQAIVAIESAVEKKLFEFYKNSNIESKRRELIARHNPHSNLNKINNNKYPWLKSDNKLIINFNFDLSAESNTEANKLNVSYDDSLLLDKDGIIDKLFDNRTMFCTVCATSLIPCLSAYNVLNSSIDEIDYSEDFDDDSDIEYSEITNDIIYNILFAILVRVDYDYGDDIVYHDSIIYDAINECNLLEVSGHDGLYVLGYNEIVLSIGDGCEVCRKIYCQPE